VEGGVSERILVHHGAGITDSGLDAEDGAFLAVPDGDSTGSPWYEQPLRWSRIGDEDGDQ